MSMRGKLIAACLIASQIVVEIAQAQSQPSAIEIFKLRDMCQANAQKIADDLLASYPSNYPNIPSVTDVVSNISVKNLHCYARLETITRLTSKTYQKTIMLYDGNTKQVLASYSLLNEEEAGGAILDKQYKGKGTTFTEAKQYIEDKMVTER